MSNLPCQSDFPLQVSKSRIETSFRSPKRYEHFSSIFLYNIYLPPIVCNALE